MPDRILIKDFSQGWIPSDDPYNGRKNGLLQMDNVELDQNGALSLTGGTAVKSSSYGTSVAHTLFSKFINGNRADYVASTDGVIYRNGTSIGVGGDSTNAAFSTAVNYTLIASGSKRIKDNGATVYNLGLTQPAVPTYNAIGFPASTTIVPLHANYVVPTGAAAVVGALLNLTADATSGIGIIQSYNIAAVPFDWANISAGVAGTDQDYIPITTTTTFGSPNIAGLTFDVLLVAPDNVGTQTSDYFRYTVKDLSELGPTPTIKMRRGDFVRHGTGTQGWNTVYGFRLTLTFYNLLFATVPMGFKGYDPTAASGFKIYGGNNVFQGSYEFAIMAVNNTAGYLGKSILSNPLGPIVTDMNTVTLDLPNCSADAQVTQVWTFARSLSGGLLDKWYRVNVSNTPNAATVLIYKSDIQALQDNVTVNLSMVSIAYTSIADKIFNIVGPIEGRWFYFTTNFMYPSDVNNPDLVDASKAVRTTSGNSEVFLWAKQVSDRAVLVGTSVDIYVLTGTFQTLPDGEIDIYYLPLGVKNAPISYDADIHDGIIYYMANDGWRSFSQGSGSVLFISPNTDRLYRGDTCSGYAPVLPISGGPGSQRFPVVAARNKLWCFIPAAGRVEVYDFSRKYWRNFNVSTSPHYTITAATSAPNGGVLLYDGGSSGINYRLIELDVRSSATPPIQLADGANLQYVRILTPIFDNGTPENRKDNLVLKIKIYTGSSGWLGLNLINDDGTSVTITTAMASSLGVTTLSYDLSAFHAINKTYQFLLYGYVSDLLLESIEVLFETRPPQVYFTKIYNTNFGTAAKKRLRAWPCVVDTLGANLLFSTYGDNSYLTGQSINSSDKTTSLIQYVNDTHAVDYGATISGGLHEFYGMGEPEIVQTFPVAKKFDQLGPEDLFRYGKIKQIEVRLIPGEAMTSLPITFYFNDTSTYVVTVTVVPNKEASYYVDLPKGVSGNIVRIELGPSTIEFHRFYVKIQVARSGDVSELTWITLS